MRSVKTGECRKMWSVENAERRRSFPNMFLFGKIRPPKGGNVFDISNPMFFRISQRKKFESHNLYVK